jgi:hypothetical protein
VTEIDKVERKLQEVPIGEYRYRHEAEFAAGFLEDAGIPYRLQIDDAGGADLGLSMLRPAVLWVRGVDADVARDLVALDDEDEPEPVVERVRIEPDAIRMPRRDDSKLTGVERMVSAGLGGALLFTAQNLPPMPLRDVTLWGCTLLGVVLVGVAIVGRAAGALGGMIQMLSGSAPR